MNPLPNVLIVDDSRANLKFLEEVLQPFEINIIYSTSGQEVLEKIKGPELALAIIDELIPVMDVHKLVAKMNEQRKGDKVPIIFLTASQVNQIELFKGYEPGIVDYIFKPLNPQLLQCKINVFLYLYGQKQIIIRNAELLRKSNEELSMIKQALEKSDEKYRIYVEKAMDAILVSDAGGRFYKVNSAACSITGYSTDELLVMTARDLFVDNEGIHERAILMDGPNARSQFVDAQILYKNGEKHWWRIEVIKLKEAFFHRFTTDINSSKLAEETLRLSEEKFSKAFLKSPYSINIARLEDGKFVDVNHAFTSVTGYSKEDIVGKTSIDLGIWVDIDKRNEAVKDLKNGIEISQREFRLKTKNNQIITCLLSSELLDINSEVCVITIMNNITERIKAEEKLRESEQLYKLLIDAATEGMMVAQDGMIRFANHKMTEVSGYSLEELYSTPFLDFIFPDDREMAIQDYQNRLLDPNLSYRNIYRCYSKNKSLIWFEVSGVVIEWEGHPTSMNFLTDITAHKKVEDFENEMLKLSVNLTGIPGPGIVQALDNALSSIGRLYSADKVYVFEIDIASDIVKNRYVWNNEGIILQDSGLLGQRCSSFPMWLEKLKQNEVIIIKDVHQLPDSWKAERELIKFLKIESIVALPLFIEDLLIGFAGLDGVLKTTEISPSEIKMFRVWSGLIASLINKYRIGKDIDQTRQNYETFFNTIDDFLIVLDEKGKIIHFNTTVTDRLGYSKEELTGNPLLMVHPPEMREEARKIIGEMLAGNADLCLVPLITKKGSLIPVETKVTHGYWNGSPAVFHVTKDITKLKLSEEKFAKVFYLNPSACGLSDIETGQYVEVNEAFTAMFGYSQEEAVGKSAVDLGMASASLINDLKSKIADDHKVLNLEAKLRSRSGEMKDVFLSAEKITLQDKTLRFTAVHDVTEQNRINLELRKNEALLAAAQRIARIGSWELNDATGELTWSEEIYRIFGYEPYAFSPTLELFMQCIHPDDLANLNEAIEAARYRRAPYSVDHRIVLPDGQVRVVHENAEIFYNDAGIAEKWIGTVQDITERKRIEEKLQSAIEKQQNLLGHIEEVRENERIAISRELHDDLGQALTAVKIDLEIIKKITSDTHVVSKVNMVSALVSNTIKTVQRLTSQLRPDILNDLGLKAAIEWYTKEFALRNDIDLRLEIDSEIEIPADASLQIFRIMQESLTNIARHAKASCVRLKLDKTDTEINFLISDDGTGISEKHIKSKSSFGILSMQERTAYLGGSFDIYRNKDGGTDILITFPINYTLK